VQDYLARVRRHMGESFVPPKEHRAADKAPSQDPQLHEGDSGYQVKRLQRVLAQRGFDPGAIDGAFGPATRKAVEAAQREHGLKPDGVTGALTWHALFAGWPT
jgi:peptidoglycan hydrolase-like protein with peptidoglycan-binding domain